VPNFRIHNKEITLRMAGQGSDLRLTEADINYLLTLLRNATSPLTTAQLVEALRQRAARQG
jgi:DNA-binding response OmpR family regulator